MFLEIRFGVLSARYLPGQTISKNEVGEVYQCRASGVAEVLGALVHEGYLTRQGRSEFAVRIWGREEVEDLFELRANFEGWAAFRAAERASDAEISLLVALAAEAREARPDDPESLERVVIENLRFHVEVMRMSRIPQIPDMARMVLPNALHRRIVWSQPADDAEQSFRMHQKIASAVAERSASMARLLMREPAGQVGRVDQAAHHLLENLLEARQLGFRNGEPGGHGVAAEFEDHPRGLLGDQIQRVTQMQARNRAP